MNQTRKQNRTKRLRIQSEKSGFNGPVGDIKKDIAIMAINKTPKEQRVGNYYTQTKNFVQGANKGLGNTYTKLEPISKVMARKREKQNGIFDVTKMLKKLFKLGKYKHIVGV
jgi:hypothetical protein